MGTINSLYNKFTQGILSIFVLLGIRYQLFDVFFNAGNSKLGNWEGTLSLFKDDYAVPVIPYEISAYLTTFSELTFSVLVLVGFMTRYAAFPLLAIAAVIQLFVYPGNENIYWMLLASTLMCFGPGKLSLDYGFCLWQQKKCA